jgi:hypothetical protein
MKILKLLSLAAVAGLLFISSANAATLEGTYTFTGPGQTHVIGDFLSGGETVDIYYNVDIDFTVGLQMLLEAWNYSTQALTGLDSLQITLYDQFDMSGNQLTYSLLPGTDDFTSGFVPEGEYSIQISGTALENGGAYQVRLSSVPLPAAFWLFGSALVGFISFGRRKAA